MDAKTANNAPVDWQQYIREAFFTAWENSTPVDLTDYAYLFEHHFDLKKIALQLGKEVSEAPDPEKTERYHKNRIRTLAHIFTESLLEITDDGKNITSKNIQKAKIMMEGESRCIYDC
jgi:hypothetical protein